MWTSYGTGRYVASEGDVLLLPRMYKRDGTVRGVVLCHGAGQLGIAAIDATNPNKAALNKAIVEAGFPVVACDLANDSWGNTTSQTRVGQAITWLQSASGGGAKTGAVLMVAYSMGNAVMVNYAKNNPSNVAAMVGVIPASDLDDIRDNNRGSWRASISTAGGTAAWSSAGTPALPAGMNPATSNAGAVGIPYRTYYASDDTVVIPATVTALTAAIGGTATNLGATGHDDDAFAQVPVAEVIDFLLAHAA